jgi:hypothetical protein
MQADVKFDFAKVYDISTFDVVKGQKFSLLTDFAGVSNWFSDNDPVLELNVIGSNAEIFAAGNGKSILLIMDEAYQVLKKITITVVEAIIDPAADIGVSAGAPVLK